MKSDDSSNKKNREKRQTDKEKKEDAYFKVPTWLEETDLSVMEIYLYSRIAGLTGESGYCWANDATLARYMKVSREYINKLEKKLVKFGLIRKEGKRQNRRIYLNTCEPQFTRNKNTKGLHVNYSSDTCEPQFTTHVNHSSQIIDNRIDNNNIYADESADTHTNPYPSKGKKANKGRTETKAVGKPPTVAEIQSRIDEKHWNEWVDAQEFFDAYDPNWRLTDGKPIRSWCCVLASWVRNNRREGKHVQRSKPQEQQKSLEERQADKDRIAALVMGDRTEYKGVRSC